MGWNSRSKQQARELQEARARIRDGNTPNATRARTPLIARPGAVCVISGDRTTYPAFAACVSTVQITPGSQLCWRLASGGGIAEARNTVVMQALEGGAGWLFLVDDDQVFSADAIGRLLKHDKDIVSANILFRQPPHSWVG